RACPGRPRRVDPAGAGGGHRGRHPGGPRVSRYADPVTVLIPVYNRAGMIATALDAALSQTHPVQVLVYDDGSDDGTPEEVLRFRDGLPAHLQERLMLVDGPRRGHGYARRWLIEHCPTEIAAWLDSDDWCAPDRIARQLALMHAGRYDAVFSWFRRWDRDPRAGRVCPIDPGKWTRERSSLEGNMGTPTALFGRRAA